MISETIKTRRSIRKFKPVVPSSEIIESLIESATMAPSASNKQPWRFIAVENREVVSSLAQAVRDSVKTIAESVDAQMQDSFISYSNYFSRFEQAPVVIATLFRKITLLSNMLDDKVPENIWYVTDRMENYSGLISTSLAIQNLLLVVHENGLGATCMTGPLLAEEKIREILSIQPSWQLAALVPVGYPDEEPEAVNRKPVERILKWIR